MNTEAENLNALKDILRGYGAEDDELDQMISDVQEVIMLRSIKQHLEALNDPTLISVVQDPARSGEDIVQYFKDHQSSIPPLSVEKYQKIAGETWADYFQHMEENR